MAPIHIGFIGAEGGYLHRAAAMEHGDGAVLDAGGHAFGEELLHLGGQGVGGNIPIVYAGLAQDDVTHGAAHQPGLESGIMQQQTNFPHCDGDFAGAQSIGTGNRNFSNPTLFYQCFTFFPGLVFNKQRHHAHFNIYKANPTQ